LRVEQSSLAEAQETFSGADAAQLLEAATIPFCALKQGRGRAAGVARHFLLGRSRWSLVGGLRLAAAGARSARGASKLPRNGS